MATTVDLVPVWDQPNDIPEKWVESVDENVASKLPAGSQVKGIFRWGFSHWTRTAKIVTEQADGTQKLFFLKVTQDEVGKAMVWGEYESMNALHSISPELTPAPIARGTFAQADNVHFFLCQFMDMTGDLPDVDTSMKMLAKLHTQSSSPNGKYGFHVPTLHGRFPQFTEWTESWEDFFTKSIRMVFDNEERSQGPDKEVQHLCRETLSKVVPRLLRPLETGGRHIKPCLIHGDLWDGNTSTNRATDTPVIFDATCIYAHNELELAPMRPERHRMGKKYREAYFNHFDASPRKESHEPEAKTVGSQPQEDEDDRGALYCLRFDMISSSLYPGKLYWRKLCVETMKRLTEKYADGYEGWAKARGEEIISK